MGDAGLVDLAERFVRLSSELDATRDAMRRLLLNGSGDTPAAPFVQARSKPGTHPNAKVAQAAEERILELLKTRPMKMAEIVAATEAKQSTVSERMRRLRQRGLAAPVGGGAWAATA